MNEHLSAPGTNSMIVNEEGGLIKFNAEFVHLGSTLDFLIDDTTDVKHRISKSSKENCSLKLKWEAIESHF